MKVLIQRVTTARVEIDGETVGAIDQGLLALVGIEAVDDEQTVQKMLHRLLRYRVFADDEGKMNRSLADIQGGLLLVSQFTLVAQTDKGLRPGFSQGASPEQGERLFDHLLSQARQQHPIVAAGRFAANMQVSLTNNGPVTFLLTS